MSIIRIAVFVAFAVLSGCGTYTPCVYKGKAVSQREANKMKDVGMPVKCPGDEDAMEKSCSDYDDCLKKMISGPDYGKKAEWK